MMRAHARRAFNALTKINAPIYDREEHGAHFILGGELRTADDSYFADYYQHDIREKLDPETGKILNAFGVRQDVIDILDAEGLFAEWINPGMMGVYDR